MVHGCGRGVGSVLHSHGVVLWNVFDTSLAESVIAYQNSGRKLFGKGIQDKVEVLRINISKKGEKTPRIEMSPRKNQVFPLNETSAIVSAELKVIWKIIEHTFFIYSIKAFNEVIYS